MAELRAKPDSTMEELETLELLKEIEALSARNCGQWSEQRKQERRPLAIRCLARFIGPATGEVYDTQAKTRDISRGGLGFVARVHFSRQAPLVVSIVLPDDQVRHLQGRVVYSRRVRDGWYLTGMSFGRVEDRRLMPISGGGTTVVRPFVPRVAGERQENAPPVSSREQTLRMLGAINCCRKLSRNTMSKIVMATMTPDHEIRRATIPVLLQIGGHEGTHLLISLLDDVNPMVQASAAEALGQLDAKAGIEPLRGLLSHKNDAVVIVAAEALGRMNNKSGLRSVVRILKSNDELARQAVRALGIILGRRFRLNETGIAAAREYAKKLRV